MKNNIIFLILLIAVKSFAISIGSNEIEGISIGSTEYYNTQYILTVNNDGNGSTTPSGANSVDSGTIVNISTTPSQGYQFAYWSVISGTGYVFGDSLQSNTTIRLNEGDVTIQANFIESILYCSDSIIGFDTVKTWTDAISMTATVYTTNGCKVYFRYGIDSTDTQIDSVVITSEQSPYIYTDTTGQLEPSTRYWLAMVDSCGTLTTTFDSVWTQDSSVLVAEWLYETVIVVDSSRPNPWYRGKVFDIYGYNLSNNDELKLGDTLLNGYVYIGNTHIQDTIPVNMPRGKYPLKINGVTKDSITVYVPKWGW